MLLSTRTKSYTPEIRLKNPYSISFNNGVIEIYEPRKEKGGAEYKK